METQKALEISRRMTTQPTSFKTVPEVFAATVRKYGNRVALREKKYGLWKDISWNTYYHRAKQVGMALNAMGLKKGDRVAIIGENCPEWVYIDLGVQCIGGVSVGIYTTSSAEQVEYLINHSESRFFFVENEEQLDKWLAFRDRSPGLEKVIVWDMTGLRHFSDPRVMSFESFLDLGEAEIKNHPDLFETLMTAVKPDDLALLIYTSGTTGPPKGAMLMHRNVTWMAEAVAAANAVYDSDEVLSFLPLCHIFERLFTVFMHIRHGYVVNFTENLETVPQNMREVSPTVGYGVPRIWEKYYSNIAIRMSDATWFKRSVFRLAQRIGEKHARQRLIYQLEPGFWLRLAYRLAHFMVFRKLKERLGFDRMRVAYSGAAPISPDVLLFFQSIGLNLLEGYGQTEGSGVTSANRTDRYKLGTVGPPIPGVEIKIAEDGEILMRSPGVFKGYFKDEETTARTLQDGWLHTGDVGELDKEQFLKIVDRKKDIIITAGGKNIAPQHIENLLKFSPYINDAVVIGDRRKYLTALIVIDEDNVTKYARDHKIQFSTYTDLSQHPEIYRLIEREVQQVNQKLARVEQVRKFKILPKKLYEEDGEVTPTLKIKRKNIQEMYSDLIEEMYSQPSTT